MSNFKVGDIVGFRQNNGVIDLDDCYKVTAINETQMHLVYIRDRNITLTVTPHSPWLEVVTYKSEENVFEKFYDEQVEG